MACRLGFSSLRSHQGDRGDRGDRGFAGSRLRDAFDVTLENAMARATDEATVEAGRQLQRGDGRALEAALELFESEPPRGSWGGSSVGTCSRSWGQPGDCTRGQVGTWRFGGDLGVLSIDECTERCKACARCAWIAHSHAHQQCDWFASCNLSKVSRRFGAETFKLRLVRPESLQQSPTASPH